MRKGQIKILESAKSIKGFPQLYVDYLETSDRTLKDLECLFNFLSWKFDVYKKDNQFAPSEEDFEIYDIVKDIKSLDWRFFYSVAKIGNKKTKDLFEKVGDSAEISGNNLNILILAINIAAGNDISIEDALDYAKSFVEDDTMRNYNDVMKDLLLEGIEWEYMFSNKGDVIKSYQVKEKEKFAEWVCKNSNIDKQPEATLKLIKSTIANGVSFSKFLEAENIKNNLFSLLEGSSYFGEEKEYFIYDPNNSIETLKNMVKTFHLKEKISMDVPKAYEIIYFFSANSLSVVFKKVSSVSAVRSYKFEAHGTLGINDDDYCISPYLKGYDKFVLFFDNLSFYKKAKNDNKLIPMSIKMLKNGINEFGAPFKQLVDFIIDAHISLGDNIYKDVRTILEKPSVYIPLSLFELEGKHTMQEVCKEKYKRDVPIDWNKGDISINYLVYKSYFAVKEEDKNILLNYCRNMRSDEEIQDFYAFMDRNKNVVNKRTKKYVGFLAYILYKRAGNNNVWINEDGEKAEESDIFTTFYDYVRMSRLLKRKIKLSFNSANKVKQAHSDVIIDYTIKFSKTPLIKIPKKSVFNGLRNLLPVEEFEWIRTRKRLIEEGYYMKHCVATYGGYINADDCAIYSFVYPPTKKRYTIEFRQSKNGEYFINQIQSKCDRGASVEVKDYVNSFLQK